MAEGHFMLIAQLTSDAVLDAAYNWLCQRRREYPDHADIWVLRRDWKQEKPRLRAELGAGRFRFGLLDRITTAEDNAVDLWSARDALVLKALTIVLSDILPVSPRCTHTKGHGGAKAAVRQVQNHLTANTFVMRTDVKSFYASIDHLLLMERLAFHIGDRRILRLLGQYLRRTVEQGRMVLGARTRDIAGLPLKQEVGSR